MHFYYNTILTSKFFLYNKGNDITALRIVLANENISFFWKLFLYGIFPFSVQYCLHALLLRIIQLLFLFILILKWYFKYFLCNPKNQSWTFKLAKLSLDTTSFTETGILHENPTPDNVSAPRHHGASTSMFSRHSGPAAVPGSSKDKGRDYHEMTQRPAEVYSQRGSTRHWGQSGCGGIGLWWTGYLIVHRKADKNTSGKLFVTIFKLVSDL